MFPTFWSLYHELTKITCGHQRPIYFSTAVCILRPRFFLDSHPLLPMARALMLTWPSFSCLANALLNNSSRLLVLPIHRFKSLAAFQLAHLLAANPGAALNLSSRSVMNMICIQNSLASGSQKQKPLPSLLSSSLAGILNPTVSYGSAATSRY